MNLLILTVGTGTAGKHSDVASGLARTIDLAAPRLFWLIPSASEKSRPVADLIRESVSNPSAPTPSANDAHQPTSPHIYSLLLPLNPSKLHPG